MQDLTTYSDKELSDHVFNDEFYLLSFLTNGLEYLFDLINEEFTHTKAQRATLVDDLIEYMDEV